MITINVLPESYRKPKASPLHELHRSPLLRLLIVAAIGLVAALAGLWQVQQARLGGLSAKAKSLTERKAAVDRLSESVGGLSMQKQVFEEVVKRRSRWATYLDRLSAIVPAGIWFTDLLIDQERGLVLQGSAVGQGGQEMVSIGRLAQDLKYDAAFSATFRDIQIESIKSAQDGDLEIVQFTLTCAFRIRAVAAR